MVFVIFGILIMSVLALKIRTLILSCCFKNTLAMKQGNLTMRQSVLSVDSIQIFIKTPVYQGHKLFLTSIFHSCKRINFDCFKLLSLVIFMKALHFQPSQHRLELHSQHQRQLVSHNADRRPVLENSKEIDPGMSRNLTSSRCGKKYQ